LSILLILSWITLLKYLSIVKPFGVLCIAISKVVKVFVVWLSVFAVIVVSFSLSFFLLAGGEATSYRGTYWSLLALFRVVNDGEKFGEIEDTNSYLNIILYLVYINIAGILMINLLIAMLNEVFLRVINRAKLEYLLHFAKIVVFYATDFVKTKEWRNYKWQYLENERLGEAAHHTDDLDESHGGHGSPLFYQAQQEDEEESQEMKPIGEHKRSVGRTARFGRTPVLPSERVAMRDTEDSVSHQKLDVIVQEIVRKEVEAALKPVMKKLHLIISLQQDLADEDRI